MAGYLIRRCLQAVPLLLGIALLSFLLLQAIPGGPSAAYRGMANVSGADLARIERELGLDQPPWVQFGSWLSRFIQGDWGTSFVARRPVLEMIMERLPNTLLLMAAALGVSVILSIPLGLIAALAWFSSDISVRLENTTDISPVGYGLQLVAAAGIIGFAAGAILGGALSGPRYGRGYYGDRYYDDGYYYDQPDVVYVEPRPVYVRPAPVYRYAVEPWTPEWYSYCESRYRSFNPDTGYYKGYDGRFHLCQ